MDFEEYRKRGKTNSKYKRFILILENNNNYFIEHENIYLNKTELCCIYKFV